MLTKAVCCLCLTCMAAAVETTDLRMDAPGLETGGEEDAPETRALQPFHTLQIKVPFNVLVAPSLKYQLTLEAEPAVRASVVADVSEGSLSLGTSAPFSTTKPVKVTVGLPADQLHVLNLAGAAFAVVVLPGFNVSTFEVTNAGTSRIAVQNVTANSVHIISAGLVIPGHLHQSPGQPRLLTSALHLYQLFHHGFCCA